MASDKLSIRVIRLTTQGTSADRPIASRLAFGVNISDSLVFKQMSGGLVLFVGLISGHLIQLVVTGDGMTLNDNNRPAYRCWSLIDKLADGGQSADEGYRALMIHHMTEVRDQIDPARVVLAVNHGLSELRIYDISLEAAIGLSSVNGGYVERLEGTTLRVTIPSPSVRSILGSAVSRLFGVKGLHSRILKSYYIGNDLICTLNEIGLHYEARLINMRTAQVICAKSLPELESTYTYTVHCIMTQIDHTSSASHGSQTGILCMTFIKTPRCHDEVRHASIDSVAVVHIWRMTVDCLSPNVDFLYTECVIESMASSAHIVEQQSSTV